MPSEPAHSPQLAPLPGRLFIARHHESVLNSLGRWTGRLDVPLTDYGLSMSRKVGELLSGERLDDFFVSTQMRTHETLLEMLDGLGKTGKIIPVHEAAALNERDYGDYTSMNKWEVEKKLGESEFQHLRRDFDYPVPHGETLKVVYGRVVPFYLSEIVPLLASGRHVLVVSSGNAIRALQKYIESISDEGIAKVEMLFGSILMYSVDGEGKMISKETRGVESHVDA